MVDDNIFQYLLAFKLFLVTFCLCIFLVVTILSLLISKV